jgi:hypothetical protein
VQAVVTANGGLPQNMNLVEHEIKGGVKSLLKDLNTHLYSGNVGASPVQLAGLAAAIDSSTAAAYAGIDPATYSDWKSGEASIAVASLNIANIRTYLFNPIRNAHGLYPDFVLCDEVFYDKVKVLADQLYQFVTVLAVGRNLKKSPFIIDQIDVSVRKLPVAIQTGNPI